VFTLNNLLSAALVMTAVRPLATSLTPQLKFMRHPSLSLLYLGSFIFGLGLTNQHTILILELPIALFVVARGWKLCCSFKTFMCPLVGHSHPPATALVSSASGALLPTPLTPPPSFSLYVYLPLSTMRSPYVSWGNCTSWAGFKRHILREEYGSFRLSADDTDGRLFEGLRHWLTKGPLC
jgi:hypothetical protein